MQSTSRGEKQFWLIAGLVLATTGLLIAATWSNIVRFHTNVTDQMLSQSEKASSSSQKLSLLRAASWWSPYDSVVVEAQRNYFTTNNQALQAFETLASSPVAIQPLYLGNNALVLLRNGVAQQYFATAGRPDVSAESLQGEATALINLGDTKLGCDKAHQASKLNLSSASISTLNWYCDVYLQGGGGVDSTTINRLQQAKLFAVAEKLLIDIASKTAQDWLALASYAQAKGESTKALELARKAYDIDRNNVVVVEVVKKYAELAGDSAMAQDLQRRLDLVQLDY